MEILKKFYNFCLNILNFVFSFFASIYFFRYDVMVKLKAFHWVFSFFIYFFFFCIFRINEIFFFEQMYPYFYFFLTSHLIAHLIVVYRRLRNDYLRTDFYELHFRLVSDFFFIIIVYCLIDYYLIEAFYEMEYFKDF